MVLDRVHSIILGMNRDLSRFDASGFDRGAGRLKEILWRLVSALVFQNPIVHGYALKRVLLRAFGARVGEGVLIKPRVSVTFPWRLSIGANAWIGEGAWIDNLAPVDIGANACVSQGAYLCTGNHDRKKPGFDLAARPIRVGDGAWIAARAVVAPGCEVGEGAFLALGSVGKGILEPMGFYEGVPAKKR